LPVLVLVPADCTRPHANLKIARPLLDKGYRCAADVLRFVSLGRYSDERVSDLLIPRTPFKGNPEHHETYIDATSSRLLSIILL
jgi:hypothetical protein